MEYSVGCTDQKKENKYSSGCIQRSCNSTDQVAVSCPVSCP